MLRSYTSVMVKSDRLIVAQLVQNQPWKGTQTFLFVYNPYSLKFYSLSLHEYRKEQ